MKKYLVLVGIIALAGISVAEGGARQIEVDVRFVELANNAACLGAPNARSLDATNLLRAAESSDVADLLCAPRMVTLDGETGTVKVVTEFRYATDVEARHVETTNGTRVIRGIALVPSGFLSRDVGVTLRATPVFDPEHNRISVDLFAEVVSDPSWQDCVATFQGLDGRAQMVRISQPLFPARQICEKLSLTNGQTIVAGGLMTGTAKKYVEERIPFLGAIPWLGRLFRSGTWVDESRNLLITVRARVLE